MNNEHALDLKVSRRKSGFSQKDSAHLLAVHPSKVSLIESGSAMPSVRDIAALTVLYGKSFESLFQGIVTEVRQSLAERLPAMPQAPKRWLSKLNRQHSLDAIAKRLEAQSDAV